MLTVRFKKLDPRAVLPAYAEPEAAGMDIAALLVDDPMFPGEHTLFPGDTAAIPTGIAIEIPRGYQGEVRPRSGLALKHGITVLNSPGTIDSSYRGEIKVILHNAGSEPYTVKTGDRIAQLVIMPVMQVRAIEVDELADTARGTGGFGSTGR